MHDNLSKQGGCQYSRTFFVFCHPAKTKNCLLEPPPQTRQLRAKFRLRENHTNSGAAISHKYLAAPSKLSMKIKKQGSPLSH